MRHQDFKDDQVSDIRFVFVAVIYYMCGSAVQSHPFLFRLIRLISSILVVELCTAGLPVCSLISTTLTVAHAFTMPPGVLKTELLDSSRDQLIESVVIQNDVETFYAGQAVTTGDFIIALEGVPDGTPMNALQRRYFERTTSTLLSTFSELPIYRVDVRDEVVSGRETSDERRRRTTTRGGLRGTRRLPAAGVSQVITTIYGTGSPSDLRAAVIETIVTNNERYRLELAREQLRPGEINELDSGAWFGDISKVSASITNFGDSAGGEESGPVNWFTPPAISLIAICFIWLAFRIYKDYVKDYMAARRAPSPEELKKLTEEGQDPETGSSETLKAMPSGSNHNRRPSLDGQGLPRGSNHSRGSNGSQTKRRPSWDGNRLPPGSNHGAERRPSLDGHARLGSSHSRGEGPNSRLGSSHSRGEGPNSRLGSSHSRGEGPNSRLGSSHSRSTQGSAPIRRNPSFEGQNKRPSLDMKTTNSEHQPRRPTTQPSLDRLQSKSVHPQNRAGQNGRGIRPSRSADFLPKPPGGTGSINRPNPNSTHSRNMASNHNRGPPAPRNLAGQNGRGVQGSNSMPMLKRPPTDLIGDPSSSDSDSDEESDSSDDGSSFASGDQEENSSTDEQSNIDSGEESSDNEKTRPQKVAGSKRGVTASRSMPVQTKSAANIDKKDDSPSSKENSKNSIKKIPEKTADIKPVLDRHDPRLPKLVSDTSESSDDSSYYSSSESDEEETGVKKGKSLPVGRTPPKRVIGKTNDSSEEASINLEDGSINSEDGSINSEDGSISTEASSPSSEESEALEPKEVAPEKRGIAASKSMPVANKKSATIFKGTPKKKNLYDYGPKNQAGEEKGIKDHSSSLSSLPKNQAGEKKGIKGHGSSLSSFLPNNQGGGTKGIKDHGSSLSSFLPKNQAGKSMPVAKKKSIPPESATDNGYITTSNAPKKVQKQSLDPAPKVQVPKVNGLKSSVKNKVADPANSETENEKEIGSCSPKSKLGIASKKSLPKNASGRNGRGVTASQSMPVTSKKIIPLKKFVRGSTSESDDEESSCSDESDSDTSDSSPIQAIKRSGKAGRGVFGATSLPVSKKAPPSKISAEDAEAPDDISDFSSSLNSKSRPGIKAAKSMPPKWVPPKVSKSVPQKREAPNRTKSFGGTGKITFQSKKTASNDSGSSVAPSKSSSKNTKKSAKTQVTHKSKQTHMTHKSAPEFKPIKHGQIQRSRSSEIKPIKRDQIKRSYSAEGMPSYGKPIKRQIKFQPKKTATPSSSSSGISVTSKNTMKSAKTHNSAPEFKPIKRTYSAEVKPSYVKPIKREIGPGNLSRSMSADRKDLIMGRLSSILPGDEDDDDVYIPKIRPKRRTVPIKSYVDTSSKHGN